MTTAHSSEYARMLCVGVELCAVSGQPLQHAPTAITKASIPVVRARDLSTRVIVDDAGFGDAERFARLQQIDADLPR
jgi:hypothetical protein